MSRIGLPWRRPPAPLACREVVELVTGWMEGTLPPREHARVDAHLAACEHCTVYVEQMRATLRVLGDIPPESLSPEAERTLLEAFREFRSQEDE